MIPLSMPFNALKHLNKNVCMTPNEYLLRCLEKKKHLDDSVWSRREDFEGKFFTSSIDFLFSQ